MLRMHAAGARKDQWSRSGGWSARSHGAGTRHDQARRRPLNSRERTATAAAGAEPTDEKRLDWSPLDACLLLFIVASEHLAVPVMVFSWNSK
ncbi:hypothetical protein DNK10_14040 [Pseudomonas daroniae]|nr:hypothetical protein DNK10_14040 [Pseudomonas daroniae]